MGLSSRRSLLQSCPLGERARGRRGHAGTVVPTETPAGAGDTGGMWCPRLQLGTWGHWSTGTARPGHAGDVQHRAGRLGELEGRKRGDEGCWGPRTGAGDKDALQEDGIWGQGHFAVGMEDWGQGCSAVAKGAGVRDALEQETETGTGLLRTGRRTWGLGCSGGGRSPSGAAQPFGSPQVGTTLHPRPNPLLGLLWSVPSAAPRHSSASAGAFHPATARAGLAAPPSRSQTLPEATSCSIYWPQTRLPAAS